MAVDGLARGLAASAKIQALEMPVASVDNFGTILQYIGEETGSFRKGYFYQVTKNAQDKYVWTRVNVQPAGTAAAVQWGDITGTLSNQVDLQASLDAKQEKLIAGANITIAPDGKTISATTGATDYDALNNKPKINNTTLTGNKSLNDLGLSNELKTINGESLIKTSSSTNIAVKTYRPLKEEWKQNPAIYGGLTLAEFCGRINADPTVAIGDAYAGNINSTKFFEGMYFEDPTEPLTSGEVNVQILSNWGTGFVQLISVTSSNHAPYFWQYTWVDGLADWVSWTDVRATQVQSGTLKKISLNGTEYNLPEGKTYTAGNGIGINNNTISVNNDIISGAALGATAIQQHQDISGKADTTYVNTELEKKQNTLIAGNNISIAADGKTISATDTKYTAGTNINIDSNNVISALAQKIGRTFTTDVTVGHLTSGTSITADMTIADILYRMLVSDVVHVTGVTLNKSSTTINVGSSETLVATVVPNNATDKSVTWSSSNPNVATVNSNGIVSGLLAGTATITVTTTDGGFMANCNVTVQTAPVQTLDIYMGGGGNDDEQEEPSQSDLPNLTKQTLNNESELVGQHGWRIVTGNSGMYSQFPTFVVPNNYEATAWSTDPEGAYPVSSIELVPLSGNLSMYFASDPIYDFPEGTVHYITVVKK